MSTISMKAPKQNIDKLEEEDRGLICHEEGSDTLTSETNLCWLFSESETKSEMGIAKTPSTSKTIPDSIASEIRKESGSEIQLPTEPKSDTVCINGSNASITKDTTNLQTDTLATMTDESKENIAMQNKCQIYAPKHPADSKPKTAPTISKSELESAKVRRHSSSSPVTKYDAKCELANEAKPRYPTPKYIVKDYIEIVPMSSKADSKNDPFNFGKVRYPTAKYVSNTAINKVTLGSQTDWKADLAGLRIIGSFTSKNAAKNEKGIVDTEEMETETETTNSSPKAKNRNSFHQTHTANHESERLSLELNCEVKVESTIDPTREGKISVSNAKFNEIEDYQSEPSKELHDKPNTDAANVRKDSKTPSKCAVSTEELSSPSIESQTVSNTDPTELKTHVTSSTKYSAENNENVTVFSVEPTSSQKQIKTKTNLAKLKMRATFPSKHCKSFEQVKRILSTESQAKPECDPLKVTKRITFPSECATSTEKVTTATLPHGKSKVDSSGGKMLCSMPSKLATSTDQVQGTAPSMDSPTDLATIRRHSAPITKYATNKQKVTVLSTLSHGKPFTDAAKLSRRSMFPSKYVASTKPGTALRANAESAKERRCLNTSSMYATSPENATPMELQTESKSNSTEARKHSTSATKHAATIEKVTVVSTDALIQPNTYSTNANYRDVSPSKLTDSIDQVIVLSTGTKTKAKNDSSRIKRRRTCPSKYDTGVHDVRTLPIEPHTKSKTKPVHLRRHYNSPSKYETTTKQMIPRSTLKESQTNANPHPEKIYKRGVSPSKYETNTKQMIATSTESQSNENTDPGKIYKFGVPPYKYEAINKQMTPTSMQSQTNANTDPEMIYTSGISPSKYDTKAKLMTATSTESHSHENTVPEKIYKFGVPPYKYEANNKQMIATSTESQSNENTDPEKVCGRDKSVFVYEAGNKQMTDAISPFKYAVNIEENPMPSMFSHTPSMVDFEGNFGTTPYKYVSSNDSKTFSIGAQTELPAYSANVRKLGTAETIEPEIVSIASQTEPNMEYAIGKFPKYVAVANKETLTTASQTPSANIKSRSTSFCKLAAGIERVIVPSTSLETNANTDLVKESSSMTSEASTETEALQAEPRNDLAKASICSSKYLGKIDKEAVSVGLQKGSKSYLLHGRMCRNLDSKFSGNHWNSSERWISTNMPQSEVMVLRHHSKDYRRPIMNTKSKLFQALVPQPTREERCKRQMNCEMPISNTKKVKEQSPEQTALKESVLPNGSIFKKSPKLPVETKVMDVVVADKNVDPMCTFSKIPKKDQEVNVVLGIVDHSNIYGRISEEHFTILENGFNDLLAKSILEASDGYPEIQIAKCEFVQGIYKITLASTDCVDRLRDLVDSMPELWPGAKLHLVSDFVLPVLTKAAFYVKSGGARRSSKEILKIIHGQNRGLIVDLWEVYHRVETAEGTFLVVGMDASSVADIKSSQGQIFFLASKISVKMEDKTLRENAYKSFQASVGSHNCKPEIGVVQPKESQPIYQANVFSELTDVHHTTESETREKYWDYYFLNKSANFFFKNDESVYEN